MLNIGSKVRVIGLPADNARHWGLPDELVGLTGNVIDVGRYLRIMFDNGAQWNFPADYEGVLEAVITNKWNPMNYVPLTEPLKLP